MVENPTGVISATTYGDIVSTPRGTGSIQGLHTKLNSHAELVEMAVTEERWERGAISAA